MPRRAVPALPTSALVVGGAGFIGSHLVDRLLDEGVSVDVVDDLSTGSLSNLAESRAKGGKLTIQQLDAGSASFADYVERRRPPVVYVLRGLAPRGRHPLAAVEALAVLVAVLEAVRAVGSKIVTVLPASQVYGEIPLRELPVKEDHERRPPGAAGVIAGSMLDLLAHYRDQHSVDYTALLFPTVYGPRLQGESNVVGACLAAVAAGEPFVLHGDGRQTRDLLYVDDAVDALFRAANRGSGMALNVGTGFHTNVRDIWSAISGDGPFTFGPRRPTDVSRVAVSPSRARLHLGWTPWTTVADGLARLRS